MKESVDRLIAELASVQHGVVARRQLRAMGIRHDAIRYRLRVGRLEQATSAVVKLAGTPDTAAARMMTAVLDTGAGAVVSLVSAAAAWGLPGFTTDPVAVIGRRGRARRDTPAFRVHEPRKLLPAHVIELDRIPTTSPSRTIFDLAGAPEIHPKRVARLLDTAWSRNLVSHASLTQMLDDLAARGRPGIALMRALLAERPANHRPPDSSSEARFQELAARVGLSGFVRQLDVGNSVGWIGRVDFVDRSRGLIVEVGDALFHGSLTDRQADEIRWAALRADGWQVVPVDGFDLFHRSDDVVRRLRTLEVSSPRQLV